MKKATLTFDICKGMNEKGENMYEKDFIDYINEICSLLDPATTTCAFTKSDDPKYELEDLTPAVINTSSPYRYVMKFNLLKNGEKVLGFKVYEYSEKVQSIEVSYFCNLKSLNPDGGTYKICYKTLCLDSCSDLWKSFYDFEANRYIILVDLEGLADRVTDDVEDEDFYVDGRLDIPELPSSIELVYYKDKMSISLGGVK